MVIHELSIFYLKHDICNNANGDPLFGYYGRTGGRT